LSITDPAAGPILAKLLEDKDEPAELRMAYVEVIGRLPGNGASAALASRAVIDPEERIREKAVDQLVQRNDKVAALLLIGVLKEAVEENTYLEQNIAVNRAAAALGRLKNPESTLPLIEALVTKHKVVIGGNGGGISPTFTNGPGGGGGGLGIGGNKPKIELHDKENVVVRDALLAMYPGVNFGFDEARWKQWYDQQMTPTVVSLRRDE
jgi:hypothetical protein